MFWRAVNRKEKYDAVIQTFRQSTVRGPHSARPQSLNGLHTGHGVKVKHKICGAFFFFPNAFFLFYVHKCGPKYMRGIASESSDCSLANLATLFFPPQLLQQLLFQKKRPAKMTLVTPHATICVTWHMTLFWLWIFRFGICFKQPILFSLWVTADLCTARVNGNIDENYDFHESI